MYNAANMSYTYWTEEVTNLETQYFVEPKMEIRRRVIGGGMRNRTEYIYPNYTSPGCIHPQVL